MARQRDPARSSLRVAGRHDRRVADRVARRRHCAIRFARLVKAAERIAAGDYDDRASRPAATASRAASARAINDIAVALAETHDRATFDRLTGVANRQALLAALFAEVERAGRYERPLSVAFVDIDHFKAVNDTYGHASATSCCAASPRRSPRTCARAT